MRVLAVAVAVLGLAALASLATCEEVELCALQGTISGERFAPVRMPGLDYAQLARDVSATSRRAVLHKDGSRRVVAGSFDITYSANVTAGTQAVIQAAADILTKVFPYASSGGAVRVSAVEFDFPGGTLGTAGSTQGTVSYCHSDNLPATTRVSAPFQRLDNGSGCSATGFEITMRLADVPSLGPWYKGIDGNVPFASFDMLTVVLHELMHGMGFFTATRGSDLSTLANTAITGACPGCGYRFDEFLFREGSDSWAADMSSAQYANLFGDNSPLFFSSSATGQVADPTMAINTTFGGMYLSGTTGSHWANSVTCTGCMADNANGLMRASITNGQAIHVVGENVATAMKLYGYEVQSCNGTTCSDCLNLGCAWCHTDSTCGTGAGGVTCSDTAQWVVSEGNCAGGNPTTTTTTTGTTTTGTATATGTTGVVTTTINPFGAASTLASDLLLL